MQKGGSRRFKADVTASLTPFVIYVMDQAMNEQSFTEYHGRTGTTTHVSSHPDRTGVIKKNGTGGGD